MTTIKKAEQMSSIGKKKRTGVPWQRQQDWDQVFDSIKKIDGLHGSDLKPVRDMAESIRHHFDQISGLIEGLCSQTCPDCNDVCCIRATIWFDFNDLLYIYFGRNYFPEKQIFKKQMDFQTTCCHFSESGCTLSRLDRPFVCTWYFCPSQTKYLSGNNIDKKNIIETHLNEIKALRKKMEAAFISSALTG